MEEILWGIPKVRFLTFAQNRGNFERFSGICALRLPAPPRPGPLWQSKGIGKDGGWLGACGEANPRNLLFCLFPTDFVRSAIHVSILSLRLCHNFPLTACLFDRITLIPDTHGQRIESGAWVSFCLYRSVAAPIGANRAIHERSASRAFLIFFCS